MAISQEVVETALQQLHDVGYAVIPGFLTDDEIQRMEAECEKLIGQIDPSRDPVSFFSTYDEFHSKKDAYFLDSADKIHYFYEEKAVNSEGKVIVDVKHAINKIGHGMISKNQRIMVLGLHLLSPVFRDISFSPKIKTLSRTAAFKDPVIVQSMYIFKQPGIGGEVTPHQDATFLFCEPVDHLVGLWFALEDATIGNGCLQFIPRSHKSVPLTRRFVLNKETGGPLTKMVGEQPNFPDSEFVPLPVRKGDLVLIHGLVVHRSSENKSAFSRHVYTMHIVERFATKWSPDNWLQVEGDFARLYDHDDNHNGVSE